MLVCICTADGTKFCGLGRLIKNVIGFFEKSRLLINKLFSSGAGHMDKAIAVGVTCNLLALMALRAEI